MNFKKAAVLSLIASATLLTACSTITAKKTPDEITTKLALERWEALKNKDYEKAWTYLSKEQRDGIAQDKYHMRFNNPIWHKIEHINTVCRTKPKTMFKLTAEEEAELKDLQEKVAAGTIDIPENWECRVGISITSANPAPMFAMKIPTLTTAVFETWVREDDEKGGKRWVHLRSN